MAKEERVLKKLCKICTIKLLENHKHLTLVYSTVLNSDKCSGCHKEEIPIDYVNLTELKGYNERAKSY